MSGFFGAISKRECVGEIFYGTDYHSHLGTKRAGMCAFNGERFVRSIHSLENAYFRNKFEPDLPRFAGAKSGIGVISDTESQPITINSHLGMFSVVSVCRIDNIKELADELLSQRVNFVEMSRSEINPTELVASIISQASSFKEGIIKVQESIKGSCSFVILTEGGLYASRDRFGRTSVVIGKREDGFAVASESSSFANLGYEFVRELAPAETVFITDEAITDVTPARRRKQICSFLWVYYGYPSSYYEGINVEDARYRCGAALAAQDEGFEECDLVAGIPDSGIGHAVGYSNATKIDYKRAFVKYTPTWPRSFMPTEQSMRSLVAKMKLLPNEAFTRDKRLVLLDDSIVRGTQLKDNVVKLIEAGAKRIHIRIACPPLIYPCVFLNFSTSRSTFDLFTRRVIRELEGTDNFTPQMLKEYADPKSERYANMLESMRKTIGADTLKFQHLDDLVKAIGLPKEDLCTHCWDCSSYME